MSKTHHYGSRSILTDSGWTRHQINQAATRFTYHQPSGCKGNRAFEERTKLTSSARAKLDQISQIYRSQAKSDEEPLNRQSGSQMTKVSRLLIAMNRRFDPLQDSVFFKEEIRRYLNCSRGEGTFCDQSDPPMIGKTNGITKG
jgi:hypothetical protein